MKTKKTKWSTQGTDAHLIRRFMSHFSRYVRQKQFNLFMALYAVKPKDKILDIGTSPDTILSDTNFFEEVYPHKHNLFIASVEDCRDVVKKYKLGGFLPIEPGKRLPFKDRSFDYVVSWATLEHVGSRKQQNEFVHELSRIGKHVFVTTPDRYSIYEPHTTLFFLHWLPFPVFRSILRILHKPFWAKEENLHPVSVKDAKKFISQTKLKIKPFRLLGVLPAHIIIYGETG